MSSLVLPRGSFGIVYLNSFEIALRKAGPNTVDIHVIEECEIDANGRDFRVIQIY